MKFCPYCTQEIGHLDYSAYFSETNYGKSNGVCGLDGEDSELQNQESRDSDNFEEYDFEYFCPECGHELTTNELLDELPDEDDCTDCVDAKEYKNNLFVFKSIEKNI